MTTTLFLRILAILLALLTGDLFAQSQRDKIPGQFIVTVDSGVNPATVAKDCGVKPKFIYRSAINGFSGSASELAHQKLRGHNRVRTIEQDAYTSADISLSWGQDRVDQRALPLNSTYNHNYTGAGVTAYIIDCGIRYDHQEFGGRASFGFDVYGGDGSDCYGHGTHVAGTVGGATYGIAPGVTLKSVKVLDCSNSGTVSGLIAGINWVIANKQLPAVANISIGAGLSSALNTAVANLMAAGVVTCVAAGNNTLDASQKSPSSEPTVITVGATDNTDTKASFSNYGSVVDWFAPGVSIYSSYNTSSSAYTYMAGTSMACPHVAGAAALILQHRPNMTAQAVRDTLFSHTTKGIVKSSLSANNHLLYTLEQANGTTPDTTHIPTASFTSSVGNLTATFTDRSTDNYGSITSWNWSFGNGSISTTRNPTCTYLAGGTYTVTLLVTDDAGATNSTTQSVVVSAPTAPSAINLTAAKYKSHGYDYVDLKWNGLTSTVGVNIYRNNNLIKTLSSANTGSYTDATGMKGAVALTYKVVATDGSQTSPNVAVQF